MAKKEKSASISSKLSSPKRKRKGVHSKCKASRGKSSKNYLKKYNGQGR